VIGYLHGKFLEVGDGKAVVIPSGIGIGYSVAVPLTGRYETLHAGAEAELWIHSHVREDAFDLYGFLSREEKEIFLTLLTVNGIGPKGALGILSKVEIPTLVKAILEGDQDSLTEIPGIGKKTAERVVVELRDSLRKKAENGRLPAEWLDAAVAAGAAAGNLGAAKAGSSLAFATVAFKDAKDALVGLGYREQEVIQALRRVQDAKSPAAARTEEIVKHALKELR
jgi:Holliday junction DNA helicase RuvA